MWLSLADASAPDQSTWALVIGPYGALALALLAIYWLTKQLAAKDQQIAESEARALAMAEKTIPALTESTQALREALQHRGPT